MHSVASRIGPQRTRRKRFRSHRCVHTGRFEAHGSAEDKANLKYILHGTALKWEDLPEHIRKQIRDCKHRRAC